MQNAIVCRDARQVLGCFFYHSYYSRSKLGVGESFMHAPRNATSVPYMLLGPMLGPVFHMCSIQCSMCGLFSAPG